MRAGIRSKLTAVLVLATLMPVAVAVVAIQTVGYKHLVKERGTAFQAGAAHIAESIHLLAKAQVSQLSDFAGMEVIGRYTEKANQQLGLLSEGELEAQIRNLEDRWPSLQTNDAELGVLLNNPLSEQLKEFQKRHPLCAEIFCTDRKGRLIASTEKTSDYWQADEDWWVQAMKLNEGRGWLEGLQFDQSSATFALDISLPIMRDGTAVGALKASLNASPLFSSVVAVLPDREIVRDVVREDGAILLRLKDSAFVPVSLKLRPQVAGALRATKVGWMITPLASEEKCLAGFAALTVHSSNTLAPMFVVVHEPAWHALRPLRLQVTALTVAGAALFILFSVAGVWIANRKIIGPITQLRSAAGAVAATVGPTGACADLAQTRTATEQLAGLRAIATHDELEGLAADFRIMGERVIRYQQQLEEDIATKTAAIQGDLDMAREFQTALMPSAYPAVPEEGGPDELSLTFRHVYKPASTMGGDFFDVVKLSRHQAGVFIADVMGHGARSALVTAILRTLLQTYAKETEEPSTLLSLVNQQFHLLTRRTQQTVFVTAFYMVADTLNRQVTCASAGHPSPFIAHRSSGAVQPLFRGLKGNPALGLFPDATYAMHSQSLEVGDVLVLFTDGVPEAVNASGAEFGTEGLLEAVRKNLTNKEGAVINAISSALSRFVGPEPYADDICLVTIDVLARQISKPTRAAGIVSTLAEVGL